MEALVDDWLFENGHGECELMNPKYPSETSHRRKLWRHLRHEGASTKDIAKYFRVSEPAVSQALGRMEAREMEKLHAKFLPLAPVGPKKFIAGESVWWAGHRATVIEDYGQTVKLWSYGDVYGPVSKSEVIER